MIPVKIDSICFDYWLIQICDEWDKKYLTKSVEIDGQIAKLNKSNRCVSIYGCHSIDRGCDSYSWQIKLNTDIVWFGVGIIEDKEEILKKYQNRTDYILKHGCGLASNGLFCIKLA